LRKIKILRFGAQKDGLSKGFGPLWRGLARDLSLIYSFFAVAMGHAFFA
jgi:hypothetical protein